jgi:hypothetical protein
MPNVMTKQRMSFRFPASDVMTWQAAADKAGLTLTEWIRRRCSGFTVLEKESKPVKQLKSVKTCEHGKAQGYHCWQCGGLAKV